MVRQGMIGLIGGMSWESSAEYYRIINREVRSRLGGVHSARSLMLSVDFGEIERLQGLLEYRAVLHHHHGRLDQVEQIFELEVILELAE